MDLEILKASVIAAAIAVAIAAAAMILVAIDRPLRDVTDPETARANVAREMIAGFGEAESADYQRAYERAREFRREDRLADAQLLYFYAARGRHARAELELATMNDPTYHSEQTSLLNKPDPFQAYKWYSAALRQGVAAAEMRLDALHAWARAAAGNGNLEAQQLLLQWR